ncbi:uncharacterized protein EAE97_012079 [Botrytis byssoidea]|uniref:Uncharacterized protein n=1 Tax=Botrytis byssoidea TaxID=139641 RepID=A0A9P5HQ33_9HELO|nr:uncharacterized protein EAE97_012079 [Botrytis byssoidea]KAF7916841.1 hypothetical protein EAE97_012079 [Botrytis byssoidea]
MGMVAISRRHKRRKGDYGKKEKRTEDEGSLVDGEAHDENCFFSDVNNDKNLGDLHGSSDDGINNSKDHSSAEEDDTGFNENNNNEYNNENDGQMKDEDDGQASDEGDHNNEDKESNEDEDEDDSQIEKPTSEIHNGFEIFESLSVFSRNGLELEQDHDVYSTLSNLECAGKTGMSSKDNGQISSSPPTYQHHTPRYLSSISIEMGLVDDEDLVETRKSNIS